MLFALDALGMIGSGSQGGRRWRREKGEGKMRLEFINLLQEELTLNLNHPTKSILAQKRLTQRTLDRLQQKVELPDRLSLDNWAQQINSQIESDSTTDTPNNRQEAMVEVNNVEGGGDWDQFTTRARQDLLSTKVNKRLNILNNELLPLVKKRKL